MTIDSRGEPDASDPLAGASLFEVGREQIKHRDRVRDLAEVYTHEREVTAMLDLVPGMFPTEDDPANHDRTFLEPSCGHGNFLVAILRRKLRTVTAARYGSGERYEHRVLRCLASVYGIDIDQENVLESRQRLHAVITAHTCRDPDSLSSGFLSAVEVILNTNIVRADTLADSQKIELVFYRPGRGGTFVREWPTLEEPESQLDMFDLLPGEPQKDAVPVHYTELAVNPNPTAAHGRNQ